MNKQSRWLLSESERWSAEGIISTEQAVRIRALYPAAASGESWGLALFSGIGATVVGLGLILLVAYNWDEIPKFGKLALVGALVAAAHGTGLWLRGRDGWRARLGDVLSLFGSMAFGVGIWLVAQVYHIEEHFPTGFLVWGLGTLAMAWALGSVLQGLLAVVTLTIWGCSETMGFGRALDWSPLLVTLGVLPVVWRSRSPVLLSGLLGSLYLLLLTNAAHWGGRGGAYAAAFALSALLVAAGKIGSDAAPTAGLVRVLRAFGWVGFVLCAYLLAFTDLVESLLRWGDENTGPGLGAIVGYRWLVFGAAAAAWGWLAWRSARGRNAVAREEWLIPIALIYSQGLAVTGFYQGAQFVAIVFNLVLVGMATMWMVRGCRGGRLRLTVTGTLLLALVVFARYFDLFDNLAARGLVFILLGGVLFAEGFYYRRRRVGAAPEEGRA